MVSAGLAMLVLAVAAVVMVLAASSRSGRTENSEDASLAVDGHESIPDGELVSPRYP